MTLESTPDPYARQLSTRATGLLREFNRAGVLDVADVHVATRVGVLGREPDERVRLALALAVRAVRLGSVCLEPATIATTVTVDPDVQAGVADLAWPDPGAWAVALSASPLVDAGPDDTAAASESERTAPPRPLRYVGGLLYLDRYWREEQVVRRGIEDRSGGGARHVVPDGGDRATSVAALDRLFDDGDPLARMAAALALTSPLTVLTGGPGTGKTATVARIVAALLDRPGAPPRIALAAPTGKAAARLQESVAEAVGLVEQDRRRLLGVTASTIHRLLGSLPASRSRFRHGRDNHLPHDVVIIDEVSMVSLTLMARVLEALRPTARLVLVGDPDQLASVEAGAVLGDIVAVQPAASAWEASSAPPPMPPSPPPPGEAAFRQLAGRALPGAMEQAWRSRVVRLSHVYRTDNPAIDDLADAIRAGDVDGVLARLAGAGIDFVSPEHAHIGATAALQRDLAGTGQATLTAARNGDAGTALAALNSHRVLCAHRDGRFGVSSWAAQVEQHLRLAVPGYGSDTLDGDPQWYVGRPVVVTTNDYDLHLYNGDTGVAVQSAAGVMVAFAAPGSPRLIAPSRLSFVLDVHAMTVHRAQGSEFDAVTFVLPDPQSPLLTRELLYTAVTRARSRVRVIGTPEAVAIAVARPIVRASGLRRAR